jgi:chemotaxis protein CheZ
VTRIYEACNFQDITGQRISKVVATLKTIETRLVSLAAAVGHGGGAAAKAGKPGPQDGAKPSDADLLNGPQLPQNAKKQDEVDALLNDVR